MIQRVGLPRLCDSRVVCFEAEAMSFPIVTVLTQG
jgi:hypothetical protein